MAETGVQKSRQNARVTNKKRVNTHWYDYLWIVTPIYFGLGFFNIMFAWLGMIFFITPLVFAFVKGNKQYCNRYCDRGKFFQLLGTKLKVSRNKPMPRWLRSKAFRYGFMVFFFTMFFQMLYVTFLVVSGAESLHEVVTLLWTFKLPWHWAYYGTIISPGVAQFAFGFYSLMLTSLLLGFVMMVLYKPRAWCVICPMGTTTQLICQFKARNDEVCTACINKAQRALKE